MFDLKQLECFVAVGEELHFGRAAKRIFMTQPPLSRQIQLLEHELDIQLFVRNSRSVRLTPAGAVFLQEARRLLEIAKNAAQTAQRVAHGESGILKVGFTAGSGYSILPEMLKKANASLKGIEIVLHEMVTGRQLDALQGHEIDVGLLRMNSELQGLEVFPVLREPLLLAVHRHHRLATGRMPTLNDLSDEPFITFSARDGKYFHDKIDGLFQSSGIRVNYVQHISQVHSILALVSAEQGIAIVPQSARAMHFDGTVLRKLKTKTLFAELFLAWRKDNPNPALPGFLRLMQRQFALRPSALS
jgi:DNA-binding transcriptional LysR family regulator